MTSRFTSIYIAALLATLPSLLQAGPQTGIDELLEKHAEAMGGVEALKAIRSTVTTSEIEIVSTKLKGRMKTWSARPCFSYTEVSLGLFTVNQGYDGESAWMVDPNGKLRFRRDEGSLRNRVTTCLLESYGYLDKGDFIFEPAGRDTVDGAPCEAFALVPEGGSRCLICFDEDSHLVKKLLVIDAEGTIEQIFKDYKSVGGVKFPFSTVTRQVETGQVIVTKTISIEVNIEIDPAIFFPPREDAADYRFTGVKRSSENVPFVYGNRHIFIPVRLAGEEEEMTFLLDSGAGMTVIDSSAAVGLGLEMKDKMPGAGAGGMTDFYLARIPGFSVKGIEFSGQTVIACSIKELIRRFSGIDISGVLGYDFLSRFTTTIDFSDLDISFFDPTSFIPPEGATAIEAPLFHKIFSFDASIDGRHKGRFLLDTGANSSVVQRSFAEEHGLLEGKRPIEISVAGAGGEDRAYMLRFRSIAFGDFVIENPVLTISLGRSGVGAFEGIGGVIGNDILERFTVSLDYAGQRVYLEKNGQFDRPFFADRCGLVLTCGPGGSIIVHMVIPRSPASSARFAPGDVITGIDGDGIGGCRDLEKVLELFKGDEGVSLKIDFERGGEKKSALVILKRYI